MSKEPAYFSQAAVARALKVSRNAVNKKREIEEFKPAFNEFGKININHPRIILWAEELGVKNLNIQGPIKTEKPQKQKDSGNVKNEPTKKKEHKGGVPIVTAPIETSNIISGDITYEDIAQMTIREVAETFGSLPGFQHFVNAQAKMMDWQEKESKFMKNRSQLVSINHYKTVFSMIDLAFRNILESPERWADQTIAIARSGKSESRIQIIDMHKETLSRILKSVKEEVLKTLDAEKN